LGDSYQNEWFVYEGLSAGDQVVVDGALTLRPGALVKAKPATEKAGTPQAGAGNNDSTKGGK
jgi:hypothetical protein